MVQERLDYLVVRLEELVSSYELAVEQALLEVGGSYNAPDKIHLLNDRVPPLAEVVRQILEIQKEVSMIRSLVED